MGERSNLQGLIVPDDVQELRERTDLVEVVAGQMKLRKAGRVFKGLCCFHNEKTPSFTVDPDKQLYYCHGCGVGGDVFSFIQKVEGLTFTEAAQRLADKSGMTLRFQGGTQKSEGSRTALLAACAASAKYFQSLLASSGEAQGARKYMESRGFSSEDAATWGLGFSPQGRDTLYRKLLEDKYASKQIIDAGLALVTDGGEHKDRFRGRVMFPVSDLSGQVVGFGARAMGDEQPKYLNSPETAIYRKAKILFGLDKAKAAMVKDGLAVVTEGYTDVIALHKIGMTNAVATCGTALGEEHFALIKRFCERVILAFDADNAGALASERGFGIHSKIGLEVLVAPLPEGKDPADVALIDGADAMAKVLEQAVPLMRFVLERELDRHRLDTPESKGKAVRAAASLLASEPSRVARGEHAFWVAHRIGVEPQEVQREVAEAAGEVAVSARAQRVDRLPGHIRVEREALAILMDSPAHLEQAIGFLNQDHFTLPEHRVLLTAMFDVARSPQEGNVMDRLPDEETRRLAAELALAPMPTKQREEVFLRLEEFRLKRQIDTHRAKLDRVEEGSEEYDRVFDELMELDVQRRRFDDR